MSKDKLSNVKLGLFVIIGTVLFIAALYMMGSKRNLFGNTITIYGKFYNVDGLMVGHNVRFGGIDIGTVEKIVFVSDSAVKVEMMINSEMKKFIRKNAIASIGTDGLMGNKLVNITPGNTGASFIQEGDMLGTLRPVETGEMVRTLKVTNDNLLTVTSDLKKITQRINTRNTLWSLLMDTAVADNVKQAIVDIRIMSRNSAVVTGDLGRIIKDIKSGEGTLGALITDTSLYGNLQQTIVKIKLTGERTAEISGDLGNIIDNTKKGEGSIGALLMDTTFVHNLNKTLGKLDKSTDLLNEDLEGLKHSFLLRRYFKKQEKEKKK